MVSDRSGSGTTWSHALRQYRLGRHCAAAHVKSTQSPTTFRAACQAQRRNGFHDSQALLGIGLSELSSFGRDDSLHQCLRLWPFTFAAKRNTIFPNHETMKSGHPLYHRTKRTDGAYPWQGYEAGDGRAPATPRDGLSLPAPPWRPAWKTGHCFWKTQKSDFHSWLLLASSRRSGVHARPSSKVPVGLLGTKIVGKREARRSQTGCTEAARLERTGCLGMRIPAG